MYNLSMFVYISRWSVNEQFGIYEKSCKAIYNSYLKHVGNVEDLKKQIYSLTLLSTIPGYDLNLYKASNEIFMDLILHINDSDQIPDITDLFDLIKSYELDISDNSSIVAHTSTNFKNFLYIIVDSPNDYHKLDLSKGNSIAEPVILSENTIHHEKGAGSLFVAFLLGIASSASWDILKSKIKDSGYYYETLSSNEIDISLITTKTSELAKVNAQDLNLVSFHKVNEFYKILFKTRYKSISVKVNKTNQITEIDIVDKLYLQDSHT